MINSCCNHLYLRERIEGLKLRFRTDMTFSEDGVFNVAYLRGLKKETTIRYFNQTLYNYVANEGQSTRKKIKNYFYMICLAWDNIDGFIGDERKSATYWRSWLSVIRNTIYHQDYRLDNIDDILSNGRTQEMIKKYRPLDLKSKLFMKALVNRKMRMVCAYYKAKSEVRNLVRKLIRGS